MRQVSNPHAAAMSPALEAAVDRSTSVSERISVALGESASLDFGGRIAVAAFSICLQHREDVLALIMLDARTSALALQRSLLEALAVGIWAKEQATDQDLERFRADKYRPTFERTIQRARKGSRGPLFASLNRHYKTLNDYTHVGVRQVSRWFEADGSIGPNYSDAQMMQNLQFIDVIGAIACILREETAGRPTEAFETLLLELLQAFAPA